jgi:hypothetical protein
MNQIISNGYLIVPCLSFIVFWVVFRDEIILWVRRKYAHNKCSSFLKANKDKYFIFPSKWNARVWPDSRFFIYDETLKSMGEARYCRELFARNFKDDVRMIGYVAPRLNLKLIKDFWTEIESSLGITGNEKIFISETNYPNFIVFTVPKRWRENRMARGFFTLFVRCSCNHYVGNFTKALTEYKLTAKILPAVRYFLEGNTIPTNSYIGFCGVVHEFEDNNIDEIKEKIKKRD